MVEVYRGTERRAVRRVHCRNVVLTYKAEAVGFLARLLKKKASSRKAPVRNISRTGMCFLSQEKLVVGQVMEMTVEFGPRVPEVKVEGQVVWVGEGEGRYACKIGVGFINVHQEARDILAKAADLIAKDDKGWQSWRFRAKTRTNKPLGALDHFHEEGEGEPEAESEGEQEPEPGQAEEEP